MPSTRDIRRRIRGVRNIQQVTRAMNMIAAARLRRAQVKAESARPFAERVVELFQDLHSSVGTRHPLLTHRPVKRIGLLVLTSDRGLCGSFNAAILREASLFIANHAAAEIALLTVGKKGNDYFRARRVVIDGHFMQPSRDVGTEEVERISQRVIADYTSGRYDQVHIAYSRFFGIMRSTPTILQLLPVGGSPVEAKPVTAAATSYQFEPGVDELLDILLTQYVAVLIYRAFVDSLASEQAARMVAMKVATDSAGDMIDRLSRDYNRARQGSITKQILEVAAGAQALGHAHGSIS